MKLQATLLALFALASPSIALAAQIQIVHGIDGRDLGLDRSLPVDIAVNGDCILQGVTYTKIAKAELEAGEYSVTIHPSDGSCSQDALLSKDVEIPDVGSFTDGLQYSIIASVTSTGDPQIAVFDDLQSAPFSRTGAVRHLGKAGQVKVDFKELGKSNRKTARVKNGQTAAFSDFFSISRFSLTAKLSAGNKTLANLRATLRGNESFIYNIFGSPQNGFKIVRQRLVYPSN
jgi:hypothetical protein